MLSTGSLDDRLYLLFMIFDVNKSKCLDPGEICALMETSEKTLDSRANTFKQRSDSLWDKLSKDQFGMVDLQEFKRAFKEEAECKGLLNLMMVRVVFLLVNLS